jgi:hypothetical protein
MKTSEKYPNVIFISFIIKKQISSKLFDVGGPNQHWKTAHNRRVFFTSDFDVKTKRFKSTNTRYYGKP